MSSHGAIIPETLIRSLPGRVSRITQGLLISVGIASTGISIAGEWSHGGTLLNSWLIDHFTFLGATLHLLLIALVLFPGRIQPLHEDLTDKDAALTAQCINSFCLRAWTWIWVFLGVFYVTVLFRNARPYAHAPIHFANVGVADMVSPALLDLFSAGSTYCLLLTYFFLTPRFLRDYVAKHRRHDQHQSSAPYNWLDWHEFWLATIAIIPISLCIILFRLFQVPVVALDEGLSIVAGLMSASVLAHFVGRMDSKFILNWQWVIPVLFLYAGIQVYSTVLYHATVINQAAFVYGAFTMKCILFVFVSNFFESRRVLYYALELVHSSGHKV